MGKWSDRLKRPPEITDKIDKTPGGEGVLSILSVDSRSCADASFVGSGGPPLEISGNTVLEARDAREGPLFSLGTPEVTDKIDKTPGAAPEARAVAIATLERTRDQLAERLVAYESRLAALDPASPAWEQGEHYFQLDELEYRATCELLNALAGLPWDRETVETAVLARHWRDLESGAAVARGG